jgi:prolyl-tRNA synthetase
MMSSRGLSTRVIGVMVMIHGDDKGLVLPPRVAPIHAVVIPVGLTAKTTPEVRDALLKQTEELTASLKAANILTELDDRDG